VVCGDPPLPSKEVRPAVVQNYYDKGFISQEFVFRAYGNDDNSFVVCFDLLVDYRYDKDKLS